MARTGFVAAVSTALLAACTTPGEVGADSSPLAGTAWRLAQLTSADTITRPGDTSRYTMEFAADGSVSLQLDCNRANGRWQSAGPGQLDFGPLAMTRALCPEGSLDTRIAGELDEVHAYTLVGDRLTLERAGAAGTIEWVRPSVQPVPR